MKQLWFNAEIAVIQQWNSSDSTMKQIRFNNETTLIHQWIKAAIAIAIIAIHWMKFQQKINFYRFDVHLDDLAYDSVRKPSLIYPWHDVENDFKGKLSAN